MKELLNAYCETKAKVDSRLAELKEKSKSADESSRGQQYTKRIIMLERESRELDDIILEIKLRIGEV